MTGYENDPTWQLDNSRVPEKKEAITHRGATIEPGIYCGYEWEHPDHVDGDWTGDGWSYTGCGHGRTVEDCKDQIDEFLDELEKL